MKKLKRIGGFISTFLLTIYNTCFADVIMPGQSPKGHGVQYNPPTNTAPYVIQTLPNIIVPLTIIGILAIVIMVCIIVIICVVMKNEDTIMKKFFVTFMICICTIAITAYATQKDMFYKDREEVEDIYLQIPIEDSERIYMIVDNQNNETVKGEYFFHAGLLRKK